MIERDELLEITTETYLQHEKLLEEARPLLTKIAKARNFVQKRDYQLKENMAFYQGNPYVLAQYRENRPWVIQMNTPYASMAIDTRCASLSASDYIGQLQPFRAEDVESIEALQNVYADAWERANMDLIIDNCIINAAVVRESYVHVILDTERKVGGRPGEITAYMLDTMSVLIDPRARSFNDARYIVVMGRITYEEAIEEYGEYKAFIPKNSGVQPDERGEKWYDNDYTTEQQDGVLTLFTVYEKEGKKIKKSVILENFIVESKILTGLKRFPVAQLVWKKAAQSAYGFGLMDDLLSLQKAIVAIESAITNTAIAYAAPQIIVRKGSGINPKIVAKTAGAPGVVYSSDIPISEAMAPVQPAKIDDKIVTLKENFEQTIDKIAGITNPFIGSIGTAGNTARGADLAVERAKIIETAVLSNIAEFLEQLTMIFIDYISTSYAGLNITSRKENVTTGKPEFQEYYVPEKVDKIDFSFYIDMDIKSQYNKDKERDALLQIYQMERQYDSPIKLINELDVLQKYSISNKEELVERYKLLSQQSVEQKATTIFQLNQAAMEFGIDQQLLLAAVAEVIESPKETPALDAFMQAADEMAQRVQAEAEATKQDLASKGVSPEFINQAEQQLSEQGVTPSVENLNLQS